MNPLAYLNGDVIQAGVVRQELPGGEDGLVSVGEAAVVLLVLVVTR